LGKNRTTGRFFGTNLKECFGKTGGICQKGNQPDRAIWKGQEGLPSSAICYQPVFEARAFFIEVCVTLLAMITIGTENKEGCDQFPANAKKPFVKSGISGNWKKTDHKGKCWKMPQGIGKHRDKG